LGWETAFREYLAAARGFDHLNLPLQAAQARLAAAEIAYWRFDRKRDSYALASSALAGYGNGTDPIFAGLLAGLQASALLDMPGGDLHAAAPTVRKLLSVARRRAATSPLGARELPRLDILAGYMEYRLDAPEQTRGFLTSARDRCRAMQDWECYAIASQNLALLAEEDKNYAFALSAYSDALQFLRPQLAPKLVADISNNLGRLQGVVGLFSSSERTHANAMREYARLGDCPGVRRTLARSGNLLVQIGILGDAKNYLERAASLGCAELLATTNARPSADVNEAGMAPAHQTARYSAVTQSARAGLCTQPIDADSLAIDGKMIVFNSLLSLGDALMLESDYAQAQRCLDAARRYASTTRGQIRLANARGAVLLERNDAAAARAAFEQALQIADEAKLPATYENRAPARLGIAKSALLAGQAADALQESYQALDSSVARGDIDQTITSLRLIAAGYRGSAEPGAAAHALEVAADLIEAVPIDELDGEKRATYLATQHTVFVELTDLLASQAGTDATAWLAFGTSERGRARSLRYAINQATRDASLEPATARYRQLLREVIQLTAQEDTTRARADLIDRLDEAALRERGNPEPLDRAQLSKTLRQLDATLVEYAVGSHDMFAFVINSGAARIVRLGDRREIASAAAELHDRLRDVEVPASDVRAAAQHLARLVLWPLTEHLSGRRLILVPDDALHTIPFTVLPWSVNSGDRLVLHHVEVSIIPSALFLTRIHATDRAHGSAPRIELIGDPVFRVSDWRRECVDTTTRNSGAPGSTRAISDWTESLPRLPGTRAEVLMIAKLARQSRPQSRVETLLGCAAVPTALRRASSEGVSLLHIATHARVDAQRPRLSALALTPESTTNAAASAFGLLDILGLKLNSSLVVLSACDTSRGRLLPGEGVLGPAQAFLQAGAGAVLASYWRIDDEITSDFMQQFYRYLLIERLPASAALRAAQLDRAASASLHDWAAFALYGWPDSSI
jgi:CHAT domain-containing protein